MITALGSYALDQINLVRAQACREGIKVNNEIADAESERQREEQQRKGDLRIMQLEETLEAQVIKSTSLLGGLTAGILPAIGSTIGAIAGASPFGLAFGVLDLSVVIGGAIAASTLGALSGGVGGVVALHKENNASEAEIGIVKADQVIAQSENKQSAAKETSDDGRQERKRARKGIARNRDEARETGQAIRAQIGGKEGAVTLRMPGSGAAQVAQARLEIALDEELGAAQDARAAKADALDLRLQGVELKRQAVDVQIANRERAAWFALGRAVLDVAATVASFGAAGGATTALNIGVKLGSAALQVGEAFQDDSEARALHLASAEVELRAKERDRDADELDVAKKLAKGVRGRTFDAAERLIDSQRYGGDGVMITSAMNLGQIAKVRAMAAIEDAKDARTDIKDAREEELAAELKSIDLKRRGDEQAETKETARQVFAIVGAVVSVIGAGASIGSIDSAASAAEKGLEATSKALEAQCDAVEKIANTAGAVTSAVGQGVQLTLTDDGRRFQREADEVKLKAKKAAGKIDDAKDLRDEARQAAERSMDAAIAMQRNLTPNLA